MGMSYLNNYEIINVGTRGNLDFDYIETYCTMRKISDSPFCSEEEFSTLWVGKR